MPANNSDFLRGQVHGDNRNQGAYNMGSAFDSKPFGGNDAQTQSGSVNAAGLPSENSAKMEGEKY